MPQPSRSLKTAMGTHGLLDLLEEISTAPRDMELRRRITLAAALLTNDIVAGRSPSDMSLTVRLKTSRALAESMRWVDLHQVNLQHLSRIAKYLISLSQSVKGSPITRTKQGAVGRYLCGIVQSELQLDDIDKADHSKEAKTSFFLATEDDAVRTIMANHLTFLASNTTLALNLEAALKARRTGAPGW